jgi:hypothetical protein
MNKILSKSTVLINRTRKSLRILVNPELCVGDKVHIGNRGVRGRNKIQDTWDSTNYKCTCLYAFMSQGGL